MLKFSLWGRCLALCLPLLLTACGGGSGSSAAAPAGLTVTPGNGQVIVSWNAVAGVDYWLMYVATASAIDIKNPPAGHVWATSVTSPYVVTGLTNGTLYAFAMNGRTGGGPGGPQSASVSSTPRAAGTTWLAGSGAAGALRGLAFGTSSADSLNYFLAVGTAGALYKTVDSVSQSLSGHTWSAVSGGPSVDFQGASYGLGRYVVVGNNGTGNNNIVSSTDLSTWTAATLSAGSTSAGLNAVASNGTTLVAVGNAGTVFYSTDGTNWSPASLPGGFSSNLYGVTYASGNSLWVAVGAGGALLTSSNGGQTWSVPNGYTPGGSDLHGIAASSGNVFVAVGSGGVVLRSTDGIAWTPQTALAVASLNAVSTDSVQFVAVGAAGNEYISTDGSNWVAASVKGGSADLYGVVGSASKYMTVGSAGATLASIN